MLHHPNHCEMCKIQSLSNDSFQLDNSSQSNFRSGSLHETDSLLCSYFLVQVKGNLVIDNNVLERSESYASWPVTLTVYLKCSMGCSFFWCM